MAPPSRYSPEFREEAVRIALNSSKTATEVSRELGMNPETLRGWVKKHKHRQVSSTGDNLTAKERAELKELRRRTQELEKENSFLRKAAAYFARDPQ
ncbi:transposase [Streptomyces sirii]|uniref:transposase n=1 Tax=Streptomyces sirii TaxID=3127701 RepID=UPI003D366D8F